MQLPALPLSEWKDTNLTLHLYLQIVGKIKLALMPRKNHWWGITLFVNHLGITTRSVPYKDGAFEIQFNFIDHELEVTSSDGQKAAFGLYDGLSVAEFYTQIFDILKSFHIHTTIIAKPYSLPDANPIQTPFAKLKDYKSYQKEYVEKYWKIMLWVDKVFNRFSGKFYGKTCPVQIYWHHMDMAITRFSGKKLSLSDNMNIANKDAYSHEVVSFGFWAGDEMVQAPAFYSYTYPSPQGIEKEPLQPAAAKWVESNGSQMALLMYDDLRQQDDPEKSLQDFLESAYQAGAKLNGWNIKELEVPELKDLK